MIELHALDRKMRDKSVRQVSDSHPTQPTVEAAAQRS